MTRSSETPNEALRRVVNEAIEKGSPVIVEKPTSMEEELGEEDLGLDEVDFADALSSLLQGFPIGDYPALEDVSVRTFSDAMLLTRDKGIVVRLHKGGEEFQVTIVRSK